MFDNNYETYPVNPNTTFTDWKLSDFAIVTRYSDVSEFIENFWESSNKGGFITEFEMILYSIKCIEKGENYFTHNLYLRKYNKCQMFNFSASDILCTERLSVLAKTISEVLIYWRENNITNDIKDFLQSEDSIFTIVLNYLVNMYKQRLSDGSPLDKFRIKGVREKLECYDMNDGIGVDELFSVEDRSVLYDALDALETKCIF